MLLVAMPLVFCFNRDDAIHETMAEYMSAMKAIEQNSTILPPCFDSWSTTLKREPVSVRFQPFLHAAGQIAAERWALNLLNHEAYCAYFLWMQLYGGKDLQPRAELKP